MTYALPPQDQRYFGMSLGVVVDNQDPLGLGRAKILIPGFIEPSTDWARPLDAALGRARGRFRVPRLQAVVAVWFNWGHPEHPYFLPGHWLGQAPIPGGSDFGAGTGVTVPTPLQTLSDPATEAPDIEVLAETDNFLVFMDDRDGRERFVIQDKPRDAQGEPMTVPTGLGLPADQQWQPEPLCCIEILGPQEGQGQSVLIRGHASVQIQCDGVVDIKGKAGVNINGRPVLPTGKPL